MLKFFSRLIIILVLALAVVAGAGFAAYHFLPTAPTSSDSTVDEDVLKDDTYNILLCGVDGKQLVADLHARERRPPQKARRQAGENHARRRGQKRLLCRCVFLFSNHVQILRRRVVALQMTHSNRPPALLAQRLLGEAQ